MTSKLAVMWFRRDLRLDDNRALHHALKSGYKVLPIFIFDQSILDKLEDKRDARVQFIHRELESMKRQLRSFGADIFVNYGRPAEVWQALIESYDIGAVYANHDYEPYARERDHSIHEQLKSKGIPFRTFKDQVIFETDEVIKDDGTPYVVYTPFSKKWLSKLTDADLKPLECAPYYDHFYTFTPEPMPALDAMGFEAFDVEYPPRETDADLLKQYADKRDLPGVKGTSRLSIHLRFGTISIRQLTALARQHSSSWLNELIWRNFYQVIIWHFPDRIENAFKREYDRIPWRNNHAEYKAWCEGRTGYPIVDAGMRELNATGFMHNRVRMITASFLTKHLLIDWRWGEAYFAAKLIDFELASNNGGWQWAAGSGCDAAPYFRVFNPELQTQKFDPNYVYIKKWVPEYGSKAYPAPIVEHKMARERAIETYKAALSAVGR